MVEQAGNRVDLSYSLAQGRFHYQITRLLNYRMPPSLQLVFCGTPNFAVPSLEKLAAAGLDIRLVVTQPDRPKGRGLESALSPVKQRSLEFRLPITQPDKIKNNDEFRAKLTALAPDAIVVVGYGHIIPQWLLHLA